MAGRKAAAAIVVLAASLMTGCVDLDAPVATVEVSVTGATIVEEDCFFGARDSASDPSWCHHLRVEIRNTDAEHDASTDRLDWEGVGSDGGVYSMPHVEGPNAVAPGRTGSLTLKFDAGPDLVLEQLRYQPAFAHQAVVAAVPAYGSA